MANTGFKQATIAYKVDATTGEALDINGNRISESGRLQAIYLLSGRPNPNIAKYEVQGYFSAGGSINGTISKIYDPVACPLGNIAVEPARVVLAPSAPPYQIVLYSDGDWTVAPNSLATLSLYSGGAGYSYITVTPSSAEGQHSFIFTNTLSRITATHRLILTNNPDLWILESGFWNNLGFWKANGIWNY